MFYRPLSFSLSMLAALTEIPGLAFFETKPAADRAHWNGLVERHDRAVLRVLLARGIRVDRARDLAQSAWAKLWEKQIAGLLPRLELPGLAIRQALFLAADERRTERPTEALSAQLGVSASSPEAHVLSRQQLALIEAELSRVVP